MHLLLALLFFATPEWPQFRGPGSTGITADDPSLPTTWSPTKNVAWATTIPGTGWSSPIVSGNLVFLTSVLSPEPVKAPKAGLYLGPKPPLPTTQIYLKAALAISGYLDYSNLSIFSFSSM